MGVPARWLQPDGEPVSCTEKLLVLKQNWEELHTVMKDAFEDAVLMGVSESEMKRLLAEMVAELQDPNRGPKSGSQTGKSA